MKARIVLFALLGILSGAGCSHQAVVGPPLVSLQNFVATPGIDYVALQMKLTPIFSMSPYAEPTRPAPALGLVTVPGTFDLRRFHPLSNPKVDYFNQHWSVNELTLQPAAMERLLQFLLQHPALYSEAIPADPGLSIMALTRTASGAEVATEVFVERKNVPAVAAQLTDSLIGTPSFETALHWEDNVW